MAILELLWTVIALGHMAKAGRVGIMYEVRTTLPSHDTNNCVRDGMGRLSLD